MRKTPTEKQYRILLNLGGGAAMVVGRRRDTEPLLRRNWVTGELRDDSHGKYYAWVRIAPDGLRALADGVAEYGLPAFGPKPQVETRVCSACGSTRYHYELKDVDEPLPEEVAA